MATNSTVIICSGCGKKNRIRTADTRKPLCGNCRKPLALVTVPLHVTDGNFAELVANSDVPVLLDLWAEWCGPCRALAPVIEELAAEFAGKAVIGKLDVDSNQATAARFGVQSIPTILILKRGVEIERIVGLQPKEAISQRLKRHL